jgi:hypothetical protein
MTNPCMKMFRGQFLKGKFKMCVFIYGLAQIVRKKEKSTFWAWSRSQASHPRCPGGGTLA